MKPIYTQDNSIVHYFLGSIVLFKFLGPTLFPNMFALAPTAEVCVICFVIWMLVILSGLYNDMERDAIVPTLPSNGLLANPF